MEKIECPEKNLEGILTYMVSREVFDKRHIYLDTMKENSPESKDLMDEIAVLLDLMDDEFEYANYQLSVHVEGCDKCRNEYNSFIRKKAMSKMRNDSGNNDQKIDSYNDLKRETDSWLLGLNIPNPI